MWKVCPCNVPENYVSTRGAHLEKHKQNMINSWRAELFWRLSNMYSHFISNRGLCSTEEDQIHNGACYLSSGTYKTHISSCYPVLSIPFMLVLWQLKEPGHQQAWYWPNKPEYSVCSIKRITYDITKYRTQTTKNVSIEIMTKWMPN